MTHAALWIALALQPPAPKTAVPAPAAAAKATEALLGGRMEEAAALYRQGVKVQPRWAEGWWFLGTIYYQRDQPKECVNAMGQFVKLAPEVSNGAAILGLCLYKTQDYPGALSMLVRAERLGLPRGEALTDAASYHAALLFIKERNYEGALRILNFFANRDPLDPKIVEAAGLAALRMDIFPAQLPTDEREMVYRVGRAVMTAGNRRTAEAVRLFESIVEDFPDAPNLHFAYGGLLINADPERGAAELRRELELQPKHLPARVLLGIEYLNHGEPEKAIRLGEEAIALAPGAFTSHVVLGRALAESGTDLTRGIAELERAAKLEPTSPQVRIALASAYTKAGRKQEAAAERAEFQRLKKLIEEQGR